MPANEPAPSLSDHSAPQGWEDELNAAWALVNEARAERDRAIETRENANSVSVRVEAENERLAMAVKQWQGHATDAQAEGDRLRAENEALKDALRGTAAEACNLLNAVGAPGAAAAFDPDYVMQQLSVETDDSHPTPEEGR